MEARHLRWRGPSGDASWLDAGCDDNVQPNNHRPVGAITLHSQSPTTDLTMLVLNRLIRRAGFGAAALGLAALVPARLAAQKGQPPNRDDRLGHRHQTGAE